MKHAIHRLGLASAVILSASSAHAFQPTGPLTDSTHLGAKVSQLTGAASRQAINGLCSVMRSGDASAPRITCARGRSAGDRMGGATPWVTYTHNSGRADTGDNSDSLHMEIDAATLQFGADRLIDGRYLAGVSLADEDTEFTNRFGDKRDSDGLSIMPYFGWLISPELLLDATAGYSNLEHDTDIVFSSSSFDVDADRKFAEVNLNYFQPLADHTEASGRFGLLWAEEDTEAKSASDTEPSREVSITQLKLGGQIAHHTAKLTPYAGLTYIRDLSVKNSPEPGYKTPVNCPPATCTDPEDDKDGWLAVAGVHGMVKEGVFLSAEWVRRYDRESLEDTTLNFTARINF